MGRYSLSASLGAALLLAAAASPARADMLNLECSDTRQGNEDYALTYWVDLEKQTITYANVYKGEVDLNTVETLPVEITTGAFNFKMSVAGSPSNVTINRINGVSTWYTPALKIQTQTFVCRKGAQPYPAGKF